VLFGAFIFTTLKEENHGLTLVNYSTTKKFVQTSALLIIYIIRTSTRCPEMSLFNQDTMRLIVGINNLIQWIYVNE